MSNDDRGLIGTIIYWILVFIFIRLLFKTIKALFYWIRYKMKYKLTIAIVSI
jgi:hypothetical protein